MNSTVTEIDNQVLHIKCPRQNRWFPFLLSCLGFLIIGPGLIEELAKPFSEFAFLHVILLSAIFLLLCLILYRNFFYRDQLFLYRGVQPISKFGLIISTDMIHGVRILPPVEAMSPEGKMDSLGLGAGRIEIDTDYGPFRFGVGLGEYMVNEIFVKIVDFCGLEMG